MSQKKKKERKEKRSEFGERVTSSTSVTLGNKFLENSHSWLVLDKNIEQAHVFRCHRVTRGIYQPT